MRLNSNFEDKEILYSALKKGEESAFAYIFKKYYGPLLNYGGRILKDEELANDIVQDSFCKFFENRKKLTIASSVQAYLYKTVYNACLDAVKHKKVQHNYINQELLDFYFDKVIQTPDAELALFDEELGQALNDAIQNLPERCREIFVLSKIEGKTNREISEQLNISIKTVESQMTSAFTKLRKELEWLLCIFFISNF